MKFLTPFLALALTGCASFKKDNKPEAPTYPPPASVVERVSAYKDGGKAALDEYGLVRMRDSIGDSALFSCLAYAGGLTEFDPAILFTEKGKPLRHPDIAASGAGTPISKDMVNGIMWCLYTLGKTDRTKALALTKAMIGYGRGHTYLGLWKFCSKDDVEFYDISTEDFLGKCVMTPAVMKDIYRLAISLGYDCDFECKAFMEIGANPVPGGNGFRRHLAVLTTTRNGLVEGAINDNSLNQLCNAAEAQPRNGLYQAACHRFKDGDHRATWGALDDETLFPLDTVATSENYCTPYLFQRDETRHETLTVEDGCIEWHAPDTKELKTDCDLDDDLIDGDLVRKLVYNENWLPCSEDHPKSMAEWLFAWALATGRI